MMRLADAAERASFLLPDADRPDCNRSFPDLVPRNIVRSRGGRGAEYPEPTLGVICSIPRQMGANDENSWVMSLPELITCGSGTVADASA